MSRKRELQQVEQAAETIGGLLMTAVEGTIADRSPEPARRCVGTFVELDRQSAPDDEGGPAQLLAMLTMVRWLSAVREELADRPERVEEVVGWIEDALGKRYRYRARYTSGALESEEGAGEVPASQRALRDEFLPTLIWLLAGAVAVHGGGEISWLRDLAAGSGSAASVLR